MKKTLALLALLVTVGAGCQSMKDAYKSQGWTPDSLNYTLQRDRKTGEQSDYFGLSWSLK